MLFLKLKVFALHPPALPDVLNIDAVVVRLQLLGKVLSVQSGREYKTILLIEEGYSEAEFLYKAWKVCTGFLTSLLTSYEMPHRCLMLSTCSLTCPASSSP